MKNIFPVVPILLCLNGCNFSAPPATAATTRIEAETKLATGDIKVVTLPEASGGKAVSIARDWQPLLFADLPTQGDEFTIWVRYKDKPILLKSDDGAAQKDLVWQWDSPSQLTWKNAGRFTRAQIGKRLVVIRGGDGGAGPTLDCVVFATDASYDPNTDKSSTGNASSDKKNDKTKSDKKKTDADKSNMGEGGAVALGIKDAPDGKLYEAEKYAAGAQIVDDAKASGGKAVRSDQDWHPVFSLPLPAGEAWKVWVRHKGGPFAVKTKAGDRWFWNKPDSWTWTETDVFNRDDLNGTLAIGRNDGGAQPDSVTIDAVVLSPSVKRDLPPDRADAKAAPLKITASVDWTKNDGTMPAATWGINENEILDPKKASDTAYQKLLGGLKTPLIRIHQGDLMNAWTDAKTRDWDVTKIRKAFAASTGYGNARIMLDMTNWPSWLSPNGVLEADKEAELVKLYGRLVKIMRDDIKRPIAYWELLNERDKDYEKDGKLNDLWRLYNKLAAAVRKEDPKAKIGGPALTWPNQVWIDGFLKNCPDAQFLTWHLYGTGDLYDTNETIFGSATGSMKDMNRAAVVSAQAVKTRKMETFLTEVNVKYSWDPYERRHQNTVGAIFLASTLHGAAKDGVSGVNLWQQKGQSYGSIISGDNTTRPTYFLYQWGTKYLSGTLNIAKSGDDKALELIAVTKGKMRSLLLLNKTRATMTISNSAKLLTGAKAERINDDGTKTTVTLSGSDLVLPGYSLTLLYSNKA